MGRRESGTLTLGLAGVGGRGVAAVVEVGVAMTGVGMGLGLVVGPERRKSRGLQRTRPMKAPVW